MRVGVAWRGAGEGASASVAVDVPASLEGRGRVVLVDTLVRVAEALAEPGLVYNLVYREPGEPECQVLAFGRIQDVAQRLDHGLSHGTFQGITQLWLALPRGVRLGAYVDPPAFDPGTGGARLAGMLAPHWWAEVGFARRGAAVLWRVELHVAACRRAEVAGLLGRMRGRLEALGG